MTTLGQQGADTVTHIVSIGVIGLVLLGFPFILGALNAIPNNVDTPTHAAVVIAICEMETVGLIMAAYYSVQYQKTPSGQITLTTIAPDGSQQSKTTTPGALTFQTQDGKQVSVPAGSTLLAS